MPPLTSHRPHDRHHDYHQAGIYLITIVVRNRMPVLSTLGTDPADPQVLLTEFGRVVADYWHNIPSRAAERGYHVRSYGQVIMPDHIHGILEIQSAMDISLGNLISPFKQACTREWRHSQGISDMTPDDMAMLGHMSHKQRRIFYKEHPERLPFFDDDYDDSILIHHDQLSAWKGYIADNPRRAILRRAMPDFMQRCLHVRYCGRDYAAFGNLFLLRRPLKQAVMCHRWRMVDGTRDYATPYETTAEYAADQKRWMDAAKIGYVTVTPGISQGELLIKHRCLDEHLPLIHIQREPIGRYWKPERSRFEACAHGSLLILAPWDVEGDSDSARFHHLNTLAQEIAAFHGPAQILPT